MNPRAASATVSRPTGAAAPAAPSRLTLMAAAALIAIAALVAYHHTFAVPFLFDDVGSIAQNPTIRHLWPVGEALSPPKGGLTVSGRPALNLTLALNYAMSGTTVGSYHVVNLVIHILAGLVLFGVVRRTLVRAPPQAGFGRAALPLALVVALIWTLHPLQTEAVTYVIQRAESLVSLFYLLTVYCFIRGVDSPILWRWQVMAVGACALGMASKEVMVSAPLIVLLYDRTFVAGTFRSALRQRPRFYLALFGTWLLLGSLVTSAAGRGGTAGLTTTVTWWAYALTQCRAIVRYLRLSVWPNPLVFDYGVGVVKNAGEVSGQALMLILLLAGTVVALRRWPAIGFAGAVFFMVLAPSSSVIPVVTQTMAEHRMYLPLAAVVVLLVLGLYALFGRRCVPLSLIWATVLGWLTVQRNQDYQSELTLWRDTVEKCPDNSRAQSSLGSVLLFNLGRVSEAMAQFEHALRLQPDNADALNNSGSALFRLGRTQEAIARYEQALQLRPDYAEAHVNLGMALTNTGQLNDAIAQFTEGIRLKPDNADAHLKLALVLWQAGRQQDAIAQHDEGLRLKAEGF